MALYCMLVVLRPSSLVLRYLGRGRRTGFRPKDEGPMTKDDSSLARGRRGLALAAAVALERSGWGELAELVPDHLFGHVHPVERLAVVDHEGHADKVRDDGTVPRPGF